jgi:hypothetical protein
MTDPVAFSPLPHSAAIELARQIDAGAPDAERLVASGFSWGIGFALSRQIADGGNASILRKSGLSPALAKAIASAIDDAIAVRPPDPAKGHNAGRKFPRKDYRVADQW